MASSRLPPHISHQYDRELEDIRARVLAMGGLVEEQLGKALDALSSGDPEPAHEVATSDYRVNRMEVQIDEECTEILARRQPAASDLRLVMAVIKTVTDLERIGDEAERIGRVVEELLAAEHPRAFFISVLAMGNHVRHMLHDALDAFARMDADAALEIAREDARVDAEQDAINRQLITYMMEDPRSISRALDVAFAVRALERIGDHARNICENVIYLVRGKDIRHLSLESAEQALKERRD